MAGRIPREFIDELLARIDIVDVVDQHVPLKKAGKDHKACCPFHDEKTPSFTVSQDKQFYHCFGCGAHGSAIGFLMSYAHMDFPEAVADLAERVGLEVPREGGADAPAARLDPLYEILGEANAWFRSQLRAHPQAARAVEYLRGRGLSGEIAAEFGLGFAPPGWDGLLQALGRGDAERTRLLEAAGMVIDKGGGKVYDRFRNRVTFPILDRRGRTVGFGARVLDAADTPKYLNSPETSVFHKGRELYGLYQARKSDAKLERLIVVEGYTDVVGLAQHGVRNAVATLGTAATEAHLDRLFRVCRDVVFCFDGDEAGRRAAWRALETALPVMRDDRQAMFMFLPEGDDPDSLVRGRGGEAFEAAVAEAESLGTFLFAHLAEQVDLGTIDGRSRLVERARPLLGRLPPGAFRELAEKRLAELTGIDALNSTTLTSGRGTAPALPPGRPPFRGKRHAPSLVRKVITWLLHYPRLASGVTATDPLRALELPGVPLLLELVETLARSPNLTTGAVLERFREHESGSHLARLALEEVPPLDEGLEREFEDSFDKLRLRAEQQRFEALARKDREERLSDDEKREFARLSVGLKTLDRDGSAPT